MHLLKLAVTVSAIMIVAACNQGDAGATEAGPSALVERGKYLASIMDCGGCHNVGSFSPQPQQGLLEGGTVGFEVPNLGIFYPPNLTPHPEAGLGRWSEADIIAAVRTGKRPDGRQLAPAMPWPAYSRLTDEDARALAAYLQSLPPSANQVPRPATKQTAPRPYLTVAEPVATAP